MGFSLSSILKILAPGASQIHGFLNKSSWGKILAPAFSENIEKSILTGGGSDVLSAIKGEGGTDIVSRINTAIDPGGAVEGATRGLGENLPEGIRQIAPVAGPVVGGILYGPGGAAAGAKIGGDIAGVSNEQSAKNAIMAAAMTYALGGGGKALGGGEAGGETILGGEEQMLGEGGDLNYRPESVENMGAEAPPESTVTPPAEGNADVSDFEKYQQEVTQAESKAGPQANAEAREGKAIVEGQEAPTPAPEAKGILTAENVKAATSLATSVYGLLQPSPSLPDVPPEMELPPNWESMTAEERAAFIRGGQARKRGRRYAGEIGQIRGGEDEDIALKKGILSGYGRGEQVLMG
jgi:hypothetical protein